METTVLQWGRYKGVYRDNGEENGNYSEFLKLLNC